MATYYLTCLNYFTAELEIERSTTVDLGSLPPDIREAITGSCLKDANVMLAVCVSANGIQYAADMVVVTGAFSCLPDFSQIVAIAIAMGKVYLIVRALTSWYCERQSKEASILYTRLLHWKYQDC